MPPRPIQLPAPANWQDFEILCRDLFAAEWKDRNAQRRSFADHSALQSCWKTFQSFSSGSRCAMARTVAPSRRVRSSHYRRARTGRTPTSSFADAALRG